jgi:hypothetical protein
VKDEGNILQRSILWIFSQLQLCSTRAMGGIFLQILKKAGSRAVDCDVPNVLMFSL